LTEQELMKTERDAKTRRGILITALVVAGLAIMFYALYVLIHLKAL
jgi:hypothetical protein